MVPTNNSLLRTRHSSTKAPSATHLPDPAGKRQEFQRGAAERMLYSIRHQVVSYAWAGKKELVEEVEDEEEEEKEEEKKRKE